MNRIDTLIELTSKTHDLLNSILDRKGCCLVCQSKPQESVPNQSEELEEWMTKEEVMTYLKISNTTYYRWIQEGKLKPRGTGEHRYYKRDLKVILQARKYRERGL